MKIRKIFAGMSALALAATMAVSASAASLKTINGSTNEKEESWDEQNNFYIDTTGIDRSKVDKIVIEYNSTFTWVNGKLAANLNVDKNTSSGNWKGFDWLGPTTANSGCECLVWDLDADGKPKYNDNVVDADNVKVQWDVNSKKGSITWSNIIAQGGLFDGRYAKGTKAYNKDEDKFSASEGDAAGVVLQVGTRNNIPVVPADQKNNPDYKPTSWTAGKFEITAVKLLDKDGKEVTAGGNTNSTGDSSSSASGKDNNTGSTTSGNGSSNSSSDSNNSKTSSGNSGSKTNTGNGTSGSKTSGGSSTGNNGGDAETGNDGNSTNTGAEGNNGGAEGNNASGSTTGDGNAQGGGNGNAASGDETNPGTGATSGLALAGIALAGAAIVLSKKKK